MNSPTQPLRDAIKSGIVSSLPENSPLKKSIEKEKQLESEKIAIDEANNLVMQRNPVILPQEAADFVDPDIPITQPITQSVTQPVATQQAAISRAPADAAPQTVPTMTSSDSSFDQVASQLDKFQSTLEAEAKERKAEAERRAALVQKKLDEVNSNPVQIDNRSLWAKSSTGQKIILGLGALLSSMNPNSAKAFQDNIQNTIETDLKLQMDQLNQQRADKNSLLAQLEKITGDADSAASAYRAQVYGVLSNKLQLTAQKAQSKIQREQALMNADIARQQQLLNKAEFMQKLEEKRAEGAVPGYVGIVKDPTEARKFKDAVTASSNITSALGQLKEINKIPFKSLRPAARADAESALGQITAELKTFKELGTLDKGVEALVDKMIQNPTNFFSFDSSNQAKIMNFEKYIKDGLNKKAQVLGLKPQGVPSSFRAE